MGLKVCQRRQTDRQRRCDNAINYWLPLIKKKPIFDESYENGFLGEMRSHKLMGSFTFDQPTVMSTPSRDVYQEVFNFTKKHFQS